MHEPRNGEVWRDVPGYDGKYKVSNFGNVLLCRFSNNQVKDKPCRKPMKQTDNGHGYLAVGLTKDGKRKTVYVHRLVAEAFVENPGGMPVVNHIDFDRQNNRADNLEWCSQEENIRHSADHMKKPKQVCQQTNTGMKHISKIGNRYRVSIDRLGISKRFGSLEDAIAFRDGVMA